MTHRLSFCSLTSLHYYLLSFTHNPKPTAATLLKNLNQTPSFILPSLAHWHIICNLQCNRSHSMTMPLPLHCHVPWLCSQCMSFWKKKSRQGRVSCTGTIHHPPASRRRWPVVVAGRSRKSIIEIFYFY